MKLKDLFEDVAAGSTGAGGMSTFNGRLFGNNLPARPLLPEDGKVPLIQYSKTKKPEKK